MRIGIVNDLVLAQAVLRRVVDSVPGCTVAWTAMDGGEAIRKAAADRPDAILMDLIMPGVDGVEATRQIMAKSPCPILIVTASVGANFGMVYEALGAGGLDAVKTPTFGPDGQLRGHQPLLDRLAKLGRQRVPIASGPALSANVAPVVDFGRLPELLVIGASTGGPDAVSRVLQSLAPAPGLAVAVVQHIGPDFAGGFVTWLARRTGLTTNAAVPGEMPEAGRVAVAVSENHLVLRPDRRWDYTVEPADYPYRPSVDVLFASVAAHWPRPGVAVLLTGMGSDGARGLLSLRQRGWHTIAQNEATSVVYGMPKAAAELGAAVQVLPLDDIGPAVRSRVTRR
jgi:two-component system response regulator WspF